MKSARTGPSAGFSLVEAMVALLMIAVSAVILLPITFDIALQTRRTTVENQRTATLNAEVENVSSIEFDALESGTTCVDFSNSHFPHTKCITVTELGNGNRKRVTVVVTPHNGYGVGADTVVVERSRPGRYNPLDP
ncbi:MAG TPA: hypothetical protein VNZ57_06585 [Longimicrobiales bacterium]|nr:hypothetical protein [Longimicrobiales bacterium]